jgi:hypothetical protein
MYQFTKQTVINSNLDSDGVTTLISGSATEFEVKRAGKFLVSKIVDVHKNPYVAGVKEVMQIDVSGYAPTAGKVLRLELDIRLTGESKEADYASTYLYFKKPQFVEVLATGVLDTDMAALVAQLNALKNRFGHSYVTATYTAGTDIIEITAKTNYQRFYAGYVQEETANANSIVQVDFVTKKTGTVTTAGKVGFGDDDFMVRSIQVPTLENTRYFGTLKDERPVLGGNYTQYTVRYKVEKDHDDGIVSGLVSVTTHVFYVKSDLVSTFEAALVAASIPVNTVQTTVTAITIGGNVYDLSDATPITLTATTTPAGVTPAVWTLSGDNTVAGALDATKISLTTAGVFTVAAGSGLANADTIGVSVTVDGFTQTGDITIQT